MSSRSLSLKAALAGAASPARPSRSPRPPAAQLGPDAAACRSGNGQAVLVTVDGFRAAHRQYPRRHLRQRSAAVPRARPDAAQDQRAGDPRRADADLRRGARRRPLCGRGPPRRQRQRPLGDWSDGGGFSRNPRMSLTNLRPRYDNVAINVGRGVTPVSVVLNYRFGLSIRPVRAARSGDGLGRAPLQPAVDRQPVAAAARPGLLRRA